MIDLPNTQRFDTCILRYRKPPMVSYSYTNTISSRIFNQKSIVEDFLMLPLRLCVVIVLRVHIVMSLQDMLLLATLP